MFLLVFDQLNRWIWRLLRARYKPLLNQIPQIPLNRLAINTAALNIRVVQGVEHRQVAFIKIKLLREATLLRSRRLIYIEASQGFKDA